MCREGGGNCKFWCELLVGGRFFLAPRSKGWGRCGGGRAVGGVRFFLFARAVKRFLGLSGMVMGLQSKVAKFRARKVLFHVI